MTEQVTQQISEGAPQQQGHGEDYSALYEYVIASQKKACSCEDEEIISEVQERLKLFRYAKVTLEKTHREYLEQKDKYKKAKSKIAEFKETLQKIEVRITELNGSFEEQNRLFLDAEEKVRVKDQELSERRITIATLKRQISELEAKYKLLLARIDEEHKHLEAEAARLRDHQQRVSSEEQQNQAEAAQIKALTEKYTLLSEVEHNQKHQLERIQKTIEGIQADKVRIQGEISHLTIDRDRLKSEIDIIVKEIRQIKTDTEVHVKEKHQIEVIIEGHIKDKDGIKEEIRKIAGENIRLLEEIKNYVKINTELSEELKKYKLNIAHHDEHLKLEIENGKRIQVKITYQEKKDLEDDGRIKTLLVKIGEAEKREAACQSDRKHLNEQITSLTTQLSTLQAKLKALEAAGKKSKGSSSSSSSSSSDDEKK